MADRVSYNVMKQFFDSKMEEMFLPATKDVHGWEKQDFIDALHAEIHAEYEEETYDIALEAPVMLQ